MFNKADVTGSRARGPVEALTGSVWVSALTGENLDEVLATIGDRLRTNDRVVTLHLPLDRGDLLAAAHREGEVIDTSSTDDYVALRVVLDPVGVARFSEWRVSGVSFVPPPYPYERLDGLKKLARTTRGRRHRLLHRHPRRRAARGGRGRIRRAPSGARGYPTSIGSLDLPHGRARRGSQRRFGVDVADRSGWPRA